jgi:hypothetical protein
MRRVEGGKVEGRRGSERVFREGKKFGGGRRAIKENWEGRKRSSEHRARQVGGLHFFCYAGVERLFWG